MDERVQWVGSRGQTGLDVVPPLDEQLGEGREARQGHYPLVGGFWRAVEDVEKVDLLENHLDVHQRFLQQQVEALREDVMNTHFHGRAIILFAGGDGLAAKTGALRFGGCGLRS